MQRYADMMMRIIRSEVCGVTADVAWDVLTEDDIKALWTLSSAHDLAHIVASALSKRGLLGDDEISKKLEKQQMMAVFRSEGLIYELEQVTSALEAAKIAHIPLKGAILRRYYPESWMRTSCDIDILVHEEDLERAGEVFTSVLGYQRGVKNKHDVSYHSQSGVHIELHYTLVEEGRTKNAAPILQTVWEHALPVNDMSYCYETDDAMFYLYHIAHIAKHFSAGGIGVKGFLDLWILDNLEGYDRGARDALLGEAELDEFCAIARRLAAHWFGGAESDEKVEKLASFILGCGVYGTLENRVSISMGTSDGGRAAALWHRIFVPYDILKLRYPVITKHRWLTPIMQVRRLCKIAFGGRLKRSVRELKANATVTKEQIEGSKSFMREMGL